MKKIILLIGGIFMYLTGFAQGDFSFGPQKNLQIAQPLITSANPSTAGEPVLVAACDPAGDGISELAVTNYNLNTIPVFKIAAPPPPTITSFSPTTAGTGTTVTITGTDFTTATAVSFGGTTATSFNIVSPTIITAVVGTANCGPVTVTASTGTASLEGFTYVSQKFPFSSSISFPDGTTTFFLATGDFNEDGRLDVAAANRDDNTVSVSMRLANGTFGSPLNLAVGSQPHCVASGDFNNDGHTDLVTANLTGGPGSGSCSVLLGNGAGGFAPQLSLSSGGTSPRVLTVGDWNGDHKLDIAVLNQVDNTLGIILGNGNGTFQPVTLQGVGNRPVYIITADVNKDNKADLVISNRFGNTVSILLGNGLGAFTITSNLPTGTEPFNIAVGDLNNDGNPDLAVSNFVSDNVSIFFGNGSGGFSVQPLLPVGDGPLGIIIADFNKDNRADLAVGNGIVGNIYIFSGDGSGSFCSRDIFTFNKIIQIIVPGDFNNDSQTDIALTLNDNSGVNAGAVILNQSPPITFSGKVYLQGAYNAETGFLSNVLNTSGILQANATTHPYKVAPFSYLNNETVGAGFFAAHLNIVDWILVELRNAITPSTLIASRAAFVKQDGTLVDTSGSVTQVSFYGVPTGSYYVAIRHRNHLGIRSASPVDFTSNAGNYDFTTASNKSFQSQSYTSTVQLGSIWAMRGGDATSDGAVRYNASGNDQNQLLNIKLGGSLSNVIMNVYAPEDLNLEGIVKYNGPDNDQNFLLNLVLGGLLSAVFNEQL